MKVLFVVRRDGRPTNSSPGRLGRDPRSDRFVTHPTYSFNCFGSGLSLLASPKK